MNSYAIQSKKGCGSAGDCHGHRKQLVGLGPACILRCITIDAASLSEACIKAPYDRELELVTDKGALMLCPAKQRALGKDPDCAIFL